jgi:hypothetical protein
MLDGTVREFSRPSPTPRLDIDHPDWAAVPDIFPHASPGEKRHHAGSKLERWRSIYKTLLLYNRINTPCCAKNSFTEHTSFIRQQHGLPMSDTPLPAGIISQRFSVAGSTQNCFLINLSPDTSCVARPWPLREPDSQQNGASERQCGVRVTPNSGESAVELTG